MINVLILYASKDARFSEDLKKTLKESARELNDQFPNRPQLKVKAVGVKDGSAVDSCCFEHDDARSLTFYVLGESFESDVEPVFRKSEKSDRRGGRVVLLVLNKAAAEMFKNKNLDFERRQTCWLEVGEEFDFFVRHNLKKLMLLESNKFKES